MLMTTEPIEYLKPAYQDMWGITQRLGFINVTSSVSKVKSWPEHIFETLSKAH